MGREGLSERALAYVERVEIERDELRQRLAEEIDLRLATQRELESKVRLLEAENATLQNTLALAVESERAVPEVGYSEVKCKGCDVRVGQSHWDNCRYHPPFAQVKFTRAEAMRQ
jgi:hypothetical protein